MNPLFNTDAYKLFHRQMYPEGTTLVYSNWTPRSSRHYSGNNKEYVVTFGIQRMIKKLNNWFEKEFFGKPKSEVIEYYREQIRNFTGVPDYDVSHIEELYDLGYVPLCFKALPEGTKCPIGVPCLTVYNTLPKFFWLTNYLETWISCELWGPMTSATIANEYREILTSWAEKTGDTDFVQFQGHDFSMRGMYGSEAAAMSGLGHLTSFVGSDTVPAFIEAQSYYNSGPNDWKNFNLVAASVPATEHSVQCAHYNGEDELEYLDHILNTFPTGIVSIVCDGFDFWHFVTKVLPQRKDEIMARDGKVVIRPDSGDPVDIICGLEGAEIHESFWNSWHETKKRENPIEYKGAIECLYDIFGGTKNDKGYIELDPHIGLIYGDSITLKRADDICSRLADKGFASTNVVLGIGSYTYQFNTRDTFGFAMKATYVEMIKPNGFKRVIKNEAGIPIDYEQEVVGKPIFKSPKTGDGTKKSAKGLLHVAESKAGILGVFDQVDWLQEGSGCLREVYRDGDFLVTDNLQTIRKRIQND